MLETFSFFLWGRYVYIHTDIFFHVFAFLTAILVAKQLSFLYRHLLHWLLDLTLDYLCSCLISILLRRAFSLCPSFRELSIHFLLVLFQFTTTVVLGWCPCPEHAGLLLSANLLSNNSVAFLFLFFFFPCNGTGVSCLLFEWSWKGEYYDAKVTLL